MKVFAIITGILTTILGFFAMTMPLRTFLGIGWILGALVLVNGITGAITAFSKKSDVWQGVFNILIAIGGVMTRIHTGVSASAETRGTQVSTPMKMKTDSVTPVSIRCEGMKSKSPRHRRLSRQPPPVLLRSPQNRLNRLRQVPPRLLPNHRPPRQSRTPPMPVFGSVLAVASSALPLLQLCFCCEKRNTHNEAIRYFNLWWS